MQPTEWMMSMSERRPCHGQRDHATGSGGRTQHTMALDLEPLLEMLNALTGAVDDRIATGGDDELSGVERGRVDPAVIAAARTSGRTPGTGIVPRRCRPWPGPGDTDPEAGGRGSSVAAGAAAARRPVAVRGSAWRPICTARRCARSTTWSRRGADTGIGQVRGVPDLRPNPTPRCRRSAIVRWPTSGRRTRGTRTSSFEGRVALISP